MYVLKIFKSNNKDSSIGSVKNITIIFIQFQDYCTDNNTDKLKFREIKSANKKGDLYWIQQTGMSSKK